MQTLIFKGAGAVHQVCKSCLMPQENNNDIVAFIAIKYSMKIYELHSLLLFQRPIVTVYMNSGLPIVFVYQ